MWQVKAKLFTEKTDEAQGELEEDEAAKEDAGIVCDVCVCDVCVYHVCVYHGMCVSCMCLFVSVNVCL